MFRKRKNERNGKDLISIEDLLTLEEHSFLERNPSKLDDPDSALARYNRLVSEEETKNMFFKLSDKCGDVSSSPQIVLGILVAILVWVILNSRFSAGILREWDNYLGGSVFTDITLFDPFPFQLLTLFLSMGSMLLANIILISQRRKEKRDRAKLDLDLNLALKTEIKYSFIDEKLQTVLRQQRDILKVTDQVVESHALDRAPADRELHSELLGELKRWGLLKENGKLTENKEKLIQELKNRSLNEDPTKF